MKPVAAADKGHCLTLAEIGYFMNYHTRYAFRAGEGGDALSPV